jgi:hypothetical protein
MQILTPLPEKRRRLDMLGVDHAVVAHFDTSYATRSVRTFLDEIATLNPIEIWEEPNFRFGSDREGNRDALRACFEVRVLDPICCGAGKIISCSWVRTLISRNKPDEVLGAAGVVGRHRADPKTVRSTALEKLASQQMLFRSAGVGGLKTAPRTSAHDCFSDHDACPINHKRLACRDLHLILLISVRLS